MLNKRVVDALDIRCGFTLIELCVATALIATLLAIILPSVGSAREAARRITCANNVRQIAIASQNYAERFGVYCSDYRAMRSLLSDLEVPADLSGVGSGLTTSPQVLICPSDTLADPGQLHVSYRVCTGNELPGGVLGRRRVALPGDITDGLSATLFFAERLIDPRDRLDTASRPPTAPDLLRSNWWVSRASENPLERAAICRDERVGMLPSFVSPTAGLRGVADGFDTALPPNHPACLDAAPGDFVGASVRRGIVPATSEHGGVNASFGDGSVRLVSPQVDADVWRAVGSRAGGELSDEI